MRVFHGSAVEVTNPEIRTGKFTKDFGEGLAKFKYPTHQICFATEASLKCLTFVESEKLSKK